MWHTLYDQIICIIALRMFTRRVARKSIILSFTKSKLFSSLNQHSRNKNNEYVKYYLFAKHEVNDKNGFNLGSKSYYR